MELDLAGMHQLVAEQGIDAETLDGALAEALRMAYLKTPHAAKHARVVIDNRAGSFTVWARDETRQEPTEDDPHPMPELGEEYDDTPKDFGRLAAATARQVIGQLFRSAEDEKIFGAFSGQKGRLITGVVQQDVNDTNNVHVSVGDVEALLPRREQVPGERYKHGERLRVYVVNVARGLKGPEIIVSRSHPELVRRLFEREVPELVSGAVSIMAIAREAGARSKIAVRANADGVNPKGALIGPGGARVRAVMENLGPEKIDIVDWSADPATFVAAALSPAVATEVNVISEKNKTAIAFIHDDQLSLAIGKEGQNARLSAKLTGWKIGIESAEAHAKALQEAAAKQPAEPSDDANTSAKEPSTPEATSPAPTPSSENEAR
ncbi:transcription termination factor NusA [Bifidobacterium crudilactis]|jgi:transcription termination/antitermination protein NusA|uniref:Transcription termination/antitermination protein NusA n=1 Tax=Bifidobacterium crudilactis TaxID=327277 RepID=A0A971CYU8_9BIFI|nr:transcription termination factor NusA [Bifidobacterium crudilactis]MCI1868360.1 transcription termination factor NusA [Bifidobacterium crudilactis]MDN5972103.1 transcription termination factor NusA [Bifidobacterium crudilactis]MDN5999986.1 transcription termination factor NusA [Bifidobacterium crudilactis]MDN6209318.1 transcription termination factor NusA [Bifidobacterium crudilactis]MDN6234855.1 transcription termination factor NusA [Bifidobacterium crudilactis]